MQYSGDAQKASELTRLILPALAQLEIPMNPINYALWYEYNLGRNEELTDTIDKIVDGTEPYDEKMAFDSSLDKAIDNAKPGDDKERLIERADKALYDAKNGGRNRVAISDKS